MAIIRCPYCHSIIDENDKYCNNCGTQLLFSEDESVEEEIPGEKIIEAEPDEDEKDYEIEEPGQETTKLIDADGEADEGPEELTEGPKKEAGTKDIGELLEEEEPGGVREAELEGDKDRTEEVILVGETAAQEAVAKEEEETRAYAAEPIEKEGPEDNTAGLGVPPAPAEKARVAEPRTDGEPAVKEAPDTEEPSAGGIEKGETEEPAPAAAPKPMTFDTQELEGIGKTVELGKERLDQLMEGLAEKQKEEEPREEAPKPGPEKKTGTLPPWADRIRSSASVVEREDTRDLGPGFMKEEAGPGEKHGETEEEEIFPRRKPSDSGIGLPEGVTQAALPFGATVREEEGEEDEAAAEEDVFQTAPAPAEAGLPEKESLRPSAHEEAEAEAALEKEPEEEERRPPFHLSVFLKAKAFDVLFIGVFWLVALWVAARSMGATLFELLSVTSGSVFLLYAVFVLIYFFLFKFFLGETLGDRLFRERE